jgi:hypothetical protein
MRPVQFTPVVTTIPVIFDPYKQTPITSTNSMDIETPASEAPSVEETVQVQAETQQPTPPRELFFFLQPLLAYYNSS